MQYIGIKNSTHDTEQRHIPPCRCLLILSHQLHVDVWLLVGAVLVLGPNGLSLMEIGVDNQRGDGRER